MFCTSCGNQVPDSAGRCPSCGRPPRPIATPGERPDPDPNTYLIASILLTLCWCTPLGLVSLVYAAKGTGLAEGGMIAEASETGRKARTWAWIGFGAGLCIWLGYGALILIGAMAETGAS